MASGEQSGLDHQGMARRLFAGSCRSVTVHFNSFYIMLDHSGCRGAIVQNEGVSPLWSAISPLATKCARSSNQLNSAISAANPPSSIARRAQLPKALSRLLQQSFKDRRVKHIDKRQFVLTNVNNGWQ